MTMQRRVRRAVLLFLLAVVLLSSLAGAVLYEIDTEAEDVEYNWIPAISIVAGIGDQVRALDMDRAVSARTEHAGASIEDAEARRGETIEGLLRELEAMPPATVVPAARVRMETAVRAFVASGSAAPSSAGSPQGGRGETAALYAAADKAVTELSAFLHEQAYVHANHVDEAVDFAGLLLGLSVLAFLAVALEAGRRFNRHIIGPLDELGRALDGLSRGDRDVRIGFQDRRDEIGDLARACVAFRDSLLSLSLAEKAREKAELEREHVAGHDLVTGLPNRATFTSLLGSALDRGGQNASTYLLVMAVDGLRSIAELHGAAVRDEMVREIARRLKAEAPQEVTARLEGGLFGVFTVGSSGSSAGAKRLAGRLLEALDRPIVIGPATLELRTRIGISTHPADARSASELVRLAELALSRGAEGARTILFEARMDRELRLEAAMEADVKAAVAGESMVPWFQPVVETATGVIFGVEMLARWPREGGEIVGPGEFIPVVDRLGLMNELTLSLMRQAFRSARDWPRDVHLGVNFSASQLKEGTLPPSLLSLLQEEDFDPHRLEVEVTEDALLNYEGAAMNALNTLRGLGASLVIDDFGMGYSSFSQLRTLAFDRLKIDRSFVQGMRGELDGRIVDAMIGLASGLGIDVVAEGVEEEWMVRLLVEKGCRFAQGFHFARPMPADELVRLLVGGRTLPAPAD